jgi:hypothetical protein
VTGLSYLDVRPVLAKLAVLERELVLVGGQAVNFWAAHYENRVPELAIEAPFASKDIDFCGDAQAVRICAERLGGKARIATFDDATPNSGTVAFVDAAGVTRTLMWSRRRSVSSVMRCTQLRCPSTFSTMPVRRQG